MSGQNRSHKEERAVGGIGGAGYENNLLKPPPPPTRFYRSVGELDLAQILRTMQKFTNTAHQGSAVSLAQGCYQRKPKCTTAEICAKINSKGDELIYLRGIGRFRGGICQVLITQVPLFFSELDQQLDLELEQAQQAQVEAKRKERERLAHEEEERVAQAREQAERARKRRAREEEEREAAAARDEFSRLPAEKQTRYGNYECWLAQPAGITWREGFRAKPNPWAQILAWLEPKTNRNSFETWFKPTRFSHTREGVLYVQVPSSEFCFIGERYGDLLIEAVDELGLEFEEVEFQCEDGD